MIFYAYSLTLVDRVSPMPPLTPSDQLIVDLLQLADEYSRIQLAARQCWVEGYSSLARANFAHHTKRYGLASYDLREHKATMIVSEAVIKPHPKESDGIRNRTKSESVEQKGLIPDASLRQFGVLVPDDLRRAQDQFKLAVTKTIMASKLSSQINEILRKLAQE